MDDRGYMQHALKLAARARGRTSPNPMVGAVLVRGGEVVGEGFHQKAGTPHAEIHALNQAGLKSRGATLYVTLEPCCHRGRTLPCVDFIVRSGVERVVVAMEDPNPRVNGGGIRRLREAGIRVEVGILEEEARALNAFFVKYITTGRPYVILKAAVTLDGRIATRTGASRWITGEAARLRVHEMRDAVDSVLVGVNTVLTDDPRLTARIPGRETRDPLRIVLDSHLRTPLDARIIADDSPAGTLIFADGDVAPERIRAYQERGVTVLVARKTFHRIDLEDVLDDLGRMEITSLLIEGGAEVHASALRKGIVDRAVFFIAPKIMGGGPSREAVAGFGVERMDEVVRLANVQVERLGDDVMVEGEVARGIGPAAGIPARQAVVQERRG